MNAHVGESSDGFEGIHGGRGFGRRNQEGERLLELAEAMNLVVLNTQFEKRRIHLVTYKSGQNETQIDYVLVRKEDKKIIMDCKVIPNESVVAQHKLVVADFSLKAIGKRKAPARNRRIKTWKLKGEKAREFRSRVERTREETYVSGISESPEEIWDDMKEIVVPAAAEKQKVGIDPSEKTRNWESQEAEEEDDDGGLSVTVEGLDYINLDNREVTYGSVNTLK
ncbi:craniofacial development protein 2-like [Macrobrachium rosenbergii]|uniref:craniofacial development protein 2-like n=1 Tax=Macrobrachium rosenbergii TaxID=79674 RepID=UPI0034D46655